MTTTWAHWATDGYDIHVVAGTKLDSYLLLDQSGGGHVPAHPLPGSVTDVKDVTYTPTFTGTASGNTVTQSGVRIDTKTGVVEVVGTLGKLRNFIVEAKVTLNNGTTFEPGPVRIHVHDSLRVAWLTPLKLTIPLDDPPPAKTLRGYRLSVLALFAEDPNDTVNVVGDITRQSGLLVDSGGTAQTITWTSAKPFVVDVDTTTGELKGNQAGTADITARFSPVYTGIGLSAVKVPVTCRGAWPSVEIKPAGKGSTALAAHNVLILPEGFASTERAQFEQLAGQLVNYLRSTVVTPLHMLPFNYWTAWVDIPGSADRGISILSAIQLDPMRLDDPNYPPAINSGVDDTIKPRTAPGATPARIWELGELAYQVGLPIPTDLADVPLATKIQQWQSLVGAAKVDATVVDAGLLGAWRMLADYRLTEERDSVFSLARGDRPRAGGGSVARTVDLHPLRMTRDHLDRFLSKLTLNGATVGSRWTYSNRDGGFVYFLCGGAPYSGVHSGDHGLSVSTLSADPDVDLVVPSTGLPKARVEVQPTPLPKTPPIEARTTMAHELAHALGLGDEYGTHALITSDDAGDIVSYPNLHLASDLLVAGKIKADAIRWRWLRIRKAALLADKPTVSGLNVTIRLQPGFDAKVKENAFHKDNVVRLRERPLERIVTVGGHKEWRTVQPSATRLKITAEPTMGVDSSGNPAVIVTATTVTPSPPLPASHPYKRDSLLVMPVPDPDHLGEDLMLTARFVEERLAEADVPLSRHKGKPCAPPNALDPKDNQGRQQYPIRLDDSPSIRLKQPWIQQYVVGIYDGGREYHCGVYHPTGACMMRSQNYFEKDVGFSYPFCHVCRYILADTHDPTLHAVIEKDFAARFAIKK